MVELMGENNPLRERLKQLIEFHDEDVPVPV